MNVRDYAALGMTAGGIKRSSRAQERQHGVHQPAAGFFRLQCSKSFGLLSPLGERLGEGVMQEAIFALNPLT